MARILYLKGEQFLHIHMCMLVHPVTYTPLIHVKNHLHGISGVADLIQQARRGIYI